MKRCILISGYVDRLQRLIEDENFHNSQGAVKALLTKELEESISIVLQHGVHFSELEFFKELETLIHQNPDVFNHAEDLIELLFCCVRSNRVGRKSREWVNPEYDSFLSERSINPRAAINESFSHGLTDKECVEINRLRKLANIDRSNEIAQKKFQMILDLDRRLGFKPENISVGYSEVNHEFIIRVKDI